MISEKRLFENYFDDMEITSPRLYNFAGDTIGRLTTANTNNLYNTIIQNITIANNALGVEIGAVKSATSTQKGTTFTNDVVMKNFKTYMSENEGVITKAVGGKKSAAYLVFYPKGQTEYRTATKTKMVALLKQVFDAATTYSSQLGAVMTAELKAFTTQWTSTRSTQVLQKGTVVENRTERTANRKALENELLVAIHTVAYLHPGNAKACGALFNFSLLAPPSRKSKKPQEGVLLTGVHGIATQKNQPKAGLHVRLVGTNFTTLTDANGLYSFTGVPPGTYTIEVANEGGDTASATVVVVNGVMEVVDLAL